MRNPVFVVSEEYTTQRSFFAGMRAIMIIIIIIIIVIIIMSLFNEDYIFRQYTNLTYGPLKSKNTNST